MKRVSDAIASVHGRRFQYGPASIVICKSDRIFKHWWRILQYPEETHDFWQSVDYFNLKTGFESLLRIEPATLEVKDKGFNYFTTEAPKN